VRLKAALTVAKYVCLIGLANFVAFAVVALWLGGDAINGKCESGHFYLANHGKYTEVSEAAFNYSRWHALSLIITHPLAMAAAAFSHYKIKRSRNDLPQSQ
jgi:hypothetical protein